MEDYMRNAILIEIALNLSVGNKMAFNSPINKKTIMKKNQQVDRNKTDPRKEQYRRK